MRGREPTGIWPPFLAQECSAHRVSRRSSTISPANWRARLGEAVNEPPDGFVRACRMSEAPCARPRVDLDLAALTQELDAVDKAGLSGGEDQHRLDHLLNCVKHMRPPPVLARMSGERALHAEQTANFGNDRCAGEWSHLGLGHRGRLRPDLAVRQAAWERPILTGAAVRALRCRLAAAPFFAVERARSRSWKLPFPKLLDPTTGRPAMDFPARQLLAG